MVTYVGTSYSVTFNTLGACIYTLRYILTSALYTYTDYSVYNICSCIGDVGKVPNCG